MLDKIVYHKRVIFCEKLLFDKTLILVMIEDNIGDNKRRDKSRKKLVTVIIIAMVVGAAFFGAIYMSGERSQGSNSAYKQENNQGGAQSSNPSTVTIDNNTVISGKLKFPERNSNLEKVNIEGSTIEYTYYTKPTNLNYTTGDYIVGTTGNGYLRKIDSIQEEGNKVILHTQNANLTDVMEKGEFSLHGYLTNKGVVSTSSIPTRHTWKWNYSKDLIDLSISHTFYTKNKIKVHVSGEVKAWVNFTFIVKISHWKIKYFQFSVKNTEIASIGISANKSVILHKEYTIWEHTFPSITFDIGFVPVVITPKMNIRVGADVDLEANASASLSMKLTTKEGVEYTDGGWHTIHSFTKDISYKEPTVNLTANIKAYAITPEIEFLIYDIAGPTADLEPYLQLQASAGASLNGLNASAHLSWGLYAGVEGHIGVKIATLPEKSFKIFDLRWKLAGSQPTPKYNILIHVAPSSGGKVILNGNSYSDGQTVSLSAGSYSISVKPVSDYKFDYWKVSGGVSVSGNTGTTTVIISGSGSIAAVFISALSPPINLQATAGNGEVTLTWLPPSNANVSYYKIYRSTDSCGGDFLAKVSGDTLSYTDNSVTNGVTYYYYIVAITTTGTTSPPSNLVSATPGDSSYSTHASTLSSLGQLSESTKNVQLTTMPNLYAINIENKIANADFTSEETIYSQHY